MRSAMNIAASQREQQPDDDKLGKCAAMSNVSLSMIPVLSNCRFMQRAAMFNTWVVMAGEWPLGNLLSGNLLSKNKPIFPAIDTRLSAQCVLDAAKRAYALGEANVRTL